MASKEKVRKGNGKGGNGNAKKAAIVESKTGQDPQEPIQAESGNGGNGKAKFVEAELVGPDQGPQGPTQAADDNGNGNGNRLHKVTDISTISIDNFAPSIFDKMVAKYEEKLVDAQLELDNAFQRLLTGIQFRTDLVHKAADATEVGNKQMLETFRSTHGVRTSEHETAEA